MPRRGYRPSTRGGKSKPKVKPVAGVRHGGARARAGRKPAAIKWGAVKLLAETGAPFEEVVTGLDIAPEVLQDKETLEKLRAAIARGNTKFKLTLRRAIKASGKKGSVQALSLMARNVLDWDSNILQQTTAPDLTGIAGRLTDVIEKLVDKKR